MLNHSYCKSYPISFLQIFTWSQLYQVDYFLPAKFLWQTYKNVQFFSRRSGWKSFILYATCSIVNWNLKYSISSPILRPIFIIIKTIRYTSLRGYDNNYLQVYFILWLVHIRNPLVHKWRTINILNSILFVMYEETWKKFSLLKYFLFKFIKTLLLK